MVNISFGSYFQSNNYKGCLNILLDSKGLPESSVFAKTYIPSKVEEVIELQNKHRYKKNIKLIEHLRK